MTDHIGDATKLVFSDTDLKRLKEWLEYVEKKFNGQRLDEFMREISQNEMKVLLARLEADEQVLNTLEYVRSSWIDLHFGATLDDELKRARKAAGKENR